MWTKIAICSLIMVTMSSYKKDKPELREGYYYSTHGHATTLYKVEKNKIEWYSDSAIKTYGCGQYKINIKDSLIEVTYDKMRKSRKPNQEVGFEDNLEIEWNSAESKFELSQYEYREESESIKNLIKRVKSLSNVEISK